MVVLDYTLAGDDATGGIDLATADEADLRYYCFQGDVVFEVDGASFSTQWGWVPVLDFAAALKFVVDALEHEDDQLLEFTESDATLEFTRDGDDVSVHASYAGDDARVPYPELVRETDRFLGRVLDDLTRAHPELAGNAFVARLADPNA